VSVLDTDRSDANYLTTGNYAGLYAASSYFVSLGRTDALYLDHFQCSPRSRSASSALAGRFNGFRDALRDNGVRLDQKKRVLRDVPLTASAYAEAVDRFMDGGGRCDVIYAGGQGTKGLCGVMHVLERRRLRVPEDVAVVGLQVSSVFTLQAYGVSVVDLLVEELGREAVRVMVELLEGGVERPLQKNLGFRFEPGSSLPPVSEVVGAAASVPT
jgi:LacI family transcriptional regulator